MARPSWNHLTLCVLLIGFAVIGAWRIEDTPSLSFDEGWVLTVAKNWAAGRGYSQYLLDRPVPPKMLNIGFPAIAPIAASFRIFGVGIWQGRLPSLLFSTASLLLLYFIAVRIFNPRAAIAALLGLLLLSGVINPVVWGKQVIGEVAAVFYLLAALGLFLITGQRGRGLMVFSGVLLGLACVTKVQFLPFVAAALGVPLVIAAFRRSWMQVRVLVWWLAGTGLSFLLLFWVQRTLVGDRTLTEPGLYTSTAFVAIPGVRLQAALGLLIQALPTVMGVLFAFRDRPAQLSNPEGITRLFLLSFTVSWLLWYALCAAAWARYMYPCLWAAAPFAGYLLDSLIRKMRESLASRRPWGGLVTVLSTVGLIIWSGSFTATALVRNFSVREDSLVQVAGFLNGLKGNPVIESFDMEVFFMLSSRNYHHPPDRVQLVLNRRSFFGENITIAYDPLVADPDYVVIGPASRGWGVYERVLQRAEFVPVGRAGKYEVYRKARPEK